MDNIQLDQSALSSLTNKINARLGGQHVSADGRNLSKESHRNPKVSKKVTSGGKNFESQANPSEKPGNSLVLQAKHQGRPKATEQQDKKRLRDGHLKSERATKPYPNKKHIRYDLNEQVVAERNTKSDRNDAINRQSSSAAAKRDPTRRPDQQNGGYKKGLGNFDSPPNQTKPRSSEFSTSNLEDDSDADGDGYDSPSVLKTAPLLQAAPGRTLKTAKGDSSRLLLEPVQEWYSNDIADISAGPSDLKPQNKVVTELHKRGKDLLQKENERFAMHNRSSSSSRQFYTTIISSGTLTDKVSALTLLVQESPLHNTRALESLIALASKRSRAQALEVLTALKDLFAQGSLLPHSRHLKVISSQAALSNPSIQAVQNYDASMPAPSPLTDAHIITWTYEDWLKGKYFEVLQILETWCNDEISYARGKAVDMIYELLREKPEQEANLLRLLVNKLGDSEKRIASKASYNLLQLQTPHPMMKINIISAIESDILFRPGQSLHAKHYAIITLNQTVLNRDDEQVTRKLLDVYFSLFAGLLAEQTVDHGREDTQRNRKGEIQGGGSKPGKMAKKKNASLGKKGASVEEAVREKITSAILTGINRAIPFTETNNEFFEKHLNTLFRITHSSNFNTSIQAMLLLQQLCESHPASLDRFYRTLYESLLDPRLLQSSKQVLYLNLLYRALKSDLNVKRVQAFGKRLLQSVAMHQPAFVCAVVYLLRELEVNFPSLSTFIDQPEDGLEEDGARSPHQNEDSGYTTGPHIATYDGKKRDPEYSNADRSCLWELDPLLQHFHPSVTLFAKCLVGHDPMPSKPTLESHTLIQFLDRFVYRHPKKHPNKWHGPSVMQPLAAADSREQLLAPERGDVGKPLVNSIAFASLPVGQVQADEMFFHKYFSKLGNTKSNSKKAKKRKEDTEDDYDESEDEIWQALLDSKPDIEGEDDDMDLDGDDFSDDAQLDAAMDDLDDSEFESEDDISDWGDLAKAYPAPDGKKMEEGTEDGVPSRRKAASKRRKELRNLPTFASADDYAAMVEDMDGEVMEP